MIDGVLGEAAVAGETFRPVSFCKIAVIQAGGIPAFDAILAAITTLVHFDGDPLPDVKLVDPGSQRRDGAGVLVAHDEFPGGLSLQRSVQDFNVGSADRGNLHLQEDLAKPWLRYRSLLHPHIIGVVEHRRRHRRGGSHGVISRFGLWIGFLNHLFL